MTGVDADLATLRKRKYICPEHRIPDCSPLLNGCSMPNQFFAALARVEAELARFREQRDALYEANWPWEWVVATREKERRKAAEARCARLQQALERIETIANEGPTWWDDPSAGVGAIARETLAGPDTPQIRPTPADNRGASSPPAIAGPDTPADSLVSETWPETARQILADSPPCDGSADCQASRHIHGCFADKGDCDHPSEHAVSQEDKT